MVGDSPSRTTVGGIVVSGFGIRPDTRCAHYGADVDVIAIRFACCGEYYPCYRCHDALADHEREVWPADAFDTPAVLCGVCGSEMTIEAYLDAGNACLECGAAFNPGCREHHHYYFEREG